MLGDSLSPLQPIQDQLLVLDGIDNEAAIRRSPSLVCSHFGVSTLLTGTYLPTGSFLDGRVGWPTTESLDRTIAARVGTQTPFDAYYWGTYPAVRSGPNQGPNGIFFHRGNAQPIDSVIDPRVAFDTLFARVDDTGTVDPAAEHRRMQRLSILDRVRGEIGRLRTQLPESDRDRMDAHLDGVRDIERRLEMPVAATCTPPNAPPSLDARSFRNTGRVTELQFSLMAQALACDLTRVACFSWSHAPGTGEYLADYGYPGFGQLHSNAHDMSYAGRSDSTRRGARDNMANLTQWRSRMIMDHLLGNMTPEVRDNTLVVWSMDMSEGGVHSNRNVPVVLIQGRDYGAFRAGRYLRWGDFDPFTNAQGCGYRGGVPMNKVLVSLANSMGLDDVTAYGDPTIDNGPLMELY